MAVARECIGAEGQARDGDHRHLVDPSAQDVYQRRCLRCQNADRANRHPCRVSAIGSGHRLLRPHHDRDTESKQAISLTFRKTPS